MREELKRLKRLLKNFPAKSLSSSKLSDDESSKDKKELAKFITVKSVDSEPKLVDFSQNTNNSYIISGEYGNLLGDLLGYLRTQKLMTTLMLSRRIEMIEVEDGVANLKSKNNDLQELEKSEKHSAALNEFFKLRGLGFKVIEQEKEFDIAEKLKEIFGDKLIVK